MFTLEQIKAAHAKVKSGADFPQYVQDLIQLGVAQYETFVSDAHTLYAANNGHTVLAPAKYAVLTVAGNSDKHKFQQDLLAHQQGKTDYPTFCSDCASSGVEKWVVDLNAMTCTYFDKNDVVMLTEAVPTP